MKVVEGIQRVLEPSLTTENLVTASTNSENWTQIILARFIQLIDRVMENKKKGVEP